MFGHLLLWPDALSGKPLLFSAAVLLVGLALLVGLVVIRRRQPVKSAPAAGALPKPAGLSGDSADRRHSARRVETPIAIHVASLPGEEQPAEGWVVNRSPGGLCLSLNTPIPVGTVVSVRLAAQADMGWVPLEVKYCSALGSRWKVGCGFQQPESQEASVLLYS